MIQTELKKVIKEVLQTLDIETDEVHLEHPVDLSMGDYSTNVAMVYAKKLGQNPKELAEKIVEKISTNKLVKKVEVAGPGFINFYLTKDFFEESIADAIRQGEKFGSNDKLKGQKILIEHSSPNLFKEFHIGHMVNNSIGEAITRIIKNSGADVTTISYPSDVGLGIAKAIWAIPSIIPSEEKSWIFSDLGLDKKINYLGLAYQEGNKQYKESEEAKKEIDEINKKIYDKSDEEINKIYEEGKRSTLQYFEKIVERLGSKFDDYIFESEAGDVGKKLVKENIGKIFEESEGAVIFKGEDFGLHTRVFLTSKGLPVYEAKDLGLLKLKFDKYNPDKSIFVTDHEQGEYMKVVLKAAEQINPVWSEKTKHIVHGRLCFPEGRLSSREGNVLTINELLGGLIADVLVKMDDSNDKVNVDVAEQIAVGAVKYSILKSSTGKNIVFDKKKSLSLEGNSCPYLQYTYARAKSVIDKGVKSSTKKINEEITEIEKLIYRFPEVVERAGDEYEPHYIATYLFDLAQVFNSFYGNNKIADNPYNVALTEAVAQTIKNGLYLLGIEAPERL